MANLLSTIAELLHFRKSLQTAASLFHLFSSHLCHLPLPSLSLSLCNSPFTLQSILGHCSAFSSSSLFFSNRIFRQRLAAPISNFSSMGLWDSLLNWLRRKWSSLNSKCVSAMACPALHEPENVDPLNVTAMACPALPLCPLAIAEAERGIPDIIKRVRAVFEKVGLIMHNESVVIRVTGCPNGCARPYMAELGLVGDGPTSYQIWLGG